MQLHERLGRTSAPVEAAADPFLELRNRVHQAVVGALGPVLSRGDVDPAALYERVVTAIRAEMEAETGLSREDRDRLVKEIADDTLGHGPLERLLADESITEIMVNGPYDVWIERSGKLVRTDVRFGDEGHLRRVLNKIVAQVGRRVDEASPMVDARLPDGSRVNAVIPPLALDGSVITIRKFSKRKMTLEDFVPLGSLTSEAVAFLRRCVKAELNILISGGTGSGKTTLLNALSGCIPDDCRVVTIEDAAELKLDQPHVLRLESRPANIEGEGQVAIRDLLKNALRMRPDRIVVGECRGAEALDMLQAMNTGHDGSLSTLHANSPRDALSRVETMVLMAGYELPVRAIRQQVASAVDLIVQLERLHDGTRKVTAITEVQRMEGDVITLQDLFRFEVEGLGEDGRIQGSLRATGLRPGFAMQFAKHGLDPSTGGVVEGPGGGAAPAGGSAAAGGLKVPAGLVR